MMEKEVLDWLLEEDQPAIRYLALTELEGRGREDGEVQSTREMISEQG